jgi:hypothetical protein
MAPAVLKIIDDDPFSYGNAFAKTGAVSLMHSLLGAFQTLVFIIWMGCLLLACSLLFFEVEAYRKQPWLSPSSDNMSNHHPYNRRSSKKSLRVADLTSNAP